MKKLVFVLFLTLGSLNFSGAALAGYDKDHDHHEHHVSKEEHEKHVNAIREAIELLEDSNPELAKRLEKAAEHHETL